MLLLHKLLCTLITGAAGFFEASSFHMSGLTEVMDAVIAIGVSPSSKQAKKTRRFNLFKRKRLARRQTLIKK